jgi:Glucose-6-phosphate dehydrogenase, C-terminal domain
LLPKLTGFVKVMAHNATAKSVGTLRGPVDNPNQRCQPSDRKPARVFSHQRPPIRPPIWPQCQVRTLRETPLPHQAHYQARPNVLRFGLEPESVVLELTGTGPRTNTLVPLTLATHLEPAELPPYARLFLDILTGNSALSIRADEAEESWRVVTPVLDAWSKELVPLQEYPAGSDGPPRPQS